MQQQRQYYFGANELNDSANHTAKVQLNDKGDEESQSVLQDSESSSFIDIDSEAAKLPHAHLNASLSTNRQLDAILELNYEASSDDEVC